MRYSNSCARIWAVLATQNATARSRSSSWMWSFQKPGTVIHCEQG